MSSPPQFEFVAGSPALCLVDTFGDRGGSGRERLTDAPALRAWLSVAGLLPDGPCAVTTRQLDQARALREAVYRACHRAIDGKPLDRADIALINQTAAHSPLRPQLQAGRIVHIAARPVEAALSTLAADALRLLGSPLRDRIRCCPDCAMVFVDTSRPGRRRWCSSARGCGNRAKVRDFRARRAAQQKGGAKG